MARLLLLMYAKSKKIYWRGLAKEKEIPVMSAGTIRQTVILGVLVGCSLLSVTAYPGVDWSTGALTVTVSATEVRGGVYSPVALARIHSESSTMRLDRGRLVRDVIPDPVALGRLIDRGYLRVNTTFNGNSVKLSVPINGPKGLREASRALAKVSAPPKSQETRPKSVPKPKVIRSEPVTSSAPVPAPPVQPAETRPPSKPKTFSSPKIQYTGVIIDARRLGVRPAMAPLIRDANGNDIISPNRVDVASASRMGFAGYAHTLADANYDPRVGNHPLEVRAISAINEHGDTVVVIPTTEAATIRSDQNLLDAFQQCRFVIVTG
jgi:hypothetical protein